MQESFLSRLIERNVERTCLDFLPRRERVSSMSLGHDSLLEYFLFYRVNGECHKNSSLLVFAIHCMANPHADPPRKTLLHNRLTYSLRLIYLELSCTEEGHPSQPPFHGEHVPKGKTLWMTSMTTNARGIDFYRLVCGYVLQGIDTSLTPVVDFVH